MMQLRHVHPSRSNYAIQHKYPIPHVTDFTTNFHGTIIFSHIDLIKAHHQISMHPIEIHKTATCTPLRLFEYKQKEI